MNHYSTKTWSITHTHDIAYDIICCSPCFALDNPTLAGIGKSAGSKRLVVLDQQLYADYQIPIYTYFQHYDIAVKIIPFVSGEMQKSLQTLSDLLQELDNFPIHRRDEPIIAVGGGVLTDVVGFAASMYRRGIPHIKIPTTLMGYIDGAIGIKNGINFNNHKNRLGSFTPPEKVLLDPLFFKTLPRRHLRNGLAEIIKIAIIANHSLFELLETQASSCLDMKCSNCACLDLAIESMVQALAPNLYEQNLARAVDFGHTFSLAYEMQFPEMILHGEAVILDILLSVFLAQHKGILTQADQSRILRLIKYFHYPNYADAVSPEALWEALAERSYHRNGLQRVPLPTMIGACTFVNDITYAELRVAYQQLNNWVQQQEHINCECRSYRN